MRPSKSINDISKVSIVLPFLLVLTFSSESFGQLYSVDFSGQNGDGANNPPSNAKWSVSSVNTSNLGGFFKVVSKNSNNVFKAQNTDQAAVWESEKISTSSVSKDLKISFDAFAARGVFENSDELKVDAVIDPGTTSPNTINLFKSSKNSSDDVEFQNIVLKNSLQKFIEYVSNSNLGSKLKIKITADNSAGTEFFGWDNVTVKAENKKGTASNQPQNFSASSSTPYEIALSWNDASAGSVSPDGYLLKAKKGGAPSAPVDGVEPTEDTDLTDGSAVLKFSYQSNSSFSQSFIGLDPNATYTFEIYSYTNALNKIKYKTTNNPSITKSTNNGSLVYDQSFKGQSGQGRDGNGKSTGQVDWSITTGAVSGYFEVRSSEVFEGANLDTKSVWKSDQIDISGKSNLSFFFKAKADGDFEASSDAFKVEAVIDRGTPKTIFSAEVDESATVNGVPHPMVFGGSSVSKGTALTANLQNFASSIDGSGSSMVIKITADNNVSSEIIGWDDLKVYNNAPKKWDGGATNDNNWSSSANWNPDGVPKSTNRVVLDNTHVQNPSNSKYTVNIDQGLSNTSIKSLTIKPNSGQSIDVVRKSGLSTFKLDGNGTVLTIGDGGTFRDESSAGLPDNFGSGEILVQSGGTYQVLNNSSFSTASLVGAINSTSSADGEVIIESTGQSIAASGKTYPTKFKLKRNSNASSNPVVYTTTGSSPLTIEGDFTIGSNVTYDATGRSQGGDLIIKGDLTNNGTLNLNSGSQTLELKGGSQQTIDGLSQVNQLTIDDPQGLNLQNSLTITSNGILTLTDGVVSFANPTSDEVILESGATVSGASASSYVAGAVKKKGSSDFEFPVGKAGQYAPIEITSLGGNSSDFTAEYFNGKPNNFTKSSNLTSTTLNNISSNESWTLDRNNTSGSAADPKVTLYWKSGMDHGIDGGNLSDLKVARYDNSTSEWVDEGNSNTTGGGTDGSLTSGTVTSFSEFTFGSNSNTDNPLPVELLNFTASPMEDFVELKWATASETNNKQFKVQKQEGEEWVNMGTVKGKGTTIKKQHYRFLDQDVQPGQTYYYRLKQVDYDGSYEYSDVKAVSFEGRQEKAAEALALYPNPVQNRLQVNLDGVDDGSYQVQIRDTRGQVIRRKVIGVQGGSLSYELGVSDLQSGAYVLTIQGSEQLYHKRFVKQR